MLKNTKQLEDVIVDLATRVDQNREEWLSTILSDKKQLFCDMTEDVDYNMYLTIKLYAIPIDNDHVHDNLLRGIYQTNLEKTQSTTLTIQIENIVIWYLVMIPALTKE